MAAYVEQPPEAPAPRHAITVMTGVPAREAGASMKRIRRTGISFGEISRQIPSTSSSPGKWSDAEASPRASPDPWMKRSTEQTRFPPHRLMGNAVQAPLALPASPGMNEGRQGGRCGTRRGSECRNSTSRNERPGTRPGLRYSVRSKPYAASSCSASSLSASALAPRFGPLFRLTSMRRTASVSDMRLTAAISRAMRSSAAS